MAIRRITTGSTFEKQVGYSRAIVCDGWVFVAGTTGYDYENMTMPESVEAQCANTLATISKALAEAGCSLDDVVRSRYIFPDGADFPKCWPLLSEAFANSLPASTMIVAGLADPAMKIEIEVTARQPE